MTKKKLKKEIERLNAENEDLRRQLYAVILMPDSSEAVMTRLHISLSDTMERAIWAPVPYSFDGILKENKS